MSTNLDLAAGSGSIVAPPVAAMPTGKSPLILGLVPYFGISRRHALAQLLLAAPLAPPDPAEAAEWVDRMTPDLRRRIAEVV